MRAYFVRHGIAEDFAASDFDRELTARGRRRVIASARVMRRLGLEPARIFTSPRLRALQTAEIIADRLERPLQIAEAVNFGFDINAAHRLCRHLGSEDEVMFVGHNPDMSLIVNELTGADIAMKKGGLARVDLYGAKAGEGELVWLIAPKVFDALDDSRKNAKLKTPKIKRPQASAPLQDLIARRWSPVGFDRERDINRDALLSILEAARWSASSSNIQPWRFLVAPRQNTSEFGRALSVLKDGNLPWARHAAVLMIAAAETHRAPSQPNRHAAHDLGQAIAQMVLQALHHNIYTHQMGGFFPEKARELYQIPEGYEPYTAIAMGYRTQDLDHLGQRYQEREASARGRKALSEIVYSGAWARAADFLD